jgi:type IV secretory pathway VirB4 component
MPDGNPHDCYKNIFGANEEEMEIIKMMASEEQHFLIKHGGDAVIANFDLSKNIELIKILSADEVSVATMNEIIENKSADPKEWLPEFFEVLKEIEKERIIEEKEMLRLAALARRKALMA